MTLSASSIWFFDCSNACAWYACSASARRCSSARYIDASRIAVVPLGSYCAASASIWRMACP